jgi:uncharacterized protein YkwD
MFTLKQFTVLALVGSTFAAPAVLERDWQGHWRGGWTWEHSSASTDVVTAMPTATATATYDVPVVTITATSAAYTVPATATASATTSASTASSSSTGDYMSIVSKWRAAGGLKALTQDATLQANALKTVQDGNGQMVHELNPGSMAQVLAPGDASSFESAYVGGWLCEIPTLPGLNGICSTMAKGWDHSDGETGHAEILTSSAYSKIGCALANGIWGCDLA